MLGQFVEALRLVHHAGTTPTIWNPYEVIRDHRDVATERGVEAALRRDASPSNYSHESKSSDRFDPRSSVTTTC